MGIQINGQTDTIFATDGNLTVSGATLPTVTDMNVTGIVTASNYFASGGRRVVALTAGDTTLWYQAAAPTGWTKVTTHDDKALRVVSGTGGGSGGSTAFSTVMASRTPGGSVSVSNAAVTLTTSTIPTHTHGAIANSGSGGGATVASWAVNGAFGANASNFGTTGNGGLGGGSHTHSNTASFTGTAMDFAVQYVDMILCSIN